MWFILPKFKIENDKVSFFTSCLPALSSSSLVLKKFALKFHLTQVPTKILYVADLGAYSQNHISEFTSMLISLLNELKASIAYIYQSEPRVWYYSSFSHSIVLNVVSLHRGENALQICRDQLIELSPKMKSIGNGHYRLYCGEENYGDNRSVRLFAMTDRFTYYNKIQSNESPKDGYVNLESCQKDQERVLKKIRTFKKAYAAICSEKLIGYDNSYLYEMIILVDK
ncbi:MAG: hypothetical protein U0T83_08420 [Bacteriovoracaceae bacterium]